MNFIVKEEKFPDKEVWNHSTKRNVYQSPEWALAHKPYLNVHPHCFVAYSGMRPIAYLLCFGWKNGFLNSLFWSGSSGGGGGPVFDTTLSPSEQEIVKKMLIERVFDSAKEAGYHNVVLYTYPDDIANVDLEGITVSTKETPILSLNTTAEDIFAHFPQKTRQYINGAQRANVIVTIGSRNDLATYRDLQLQFVHQRGLRVSRINTLEGMETSWDALITRNRIRMYIARVGEKVVGMSILLYSEDTVFHQSVMIVQGAENLHVSHALQWKVICDAIQEGFSAYNFVGAPGRNTPRGGVTEFKLKFSAQLVSFKRYSRHSVPLVFRVLKKIFKTVGFDPEAPILFYP